MNFQIMIKYFPVTLLMLLVFIGLFALQIITGVDANAPSTADLVKWGANTVPLTLSYEPWRLVSSGFLHIGLMHLMFNSFAIYFFGQVAEPIFGKVRFLLIFILSVIGGNLLNSYIVWGDIVHYESVGKEIPLASLQMVSAGASGGIMGLGAALLMLALFKVSHNGMILNFRDLLLVMGINLVYGFVGTGIDNAAHIGGAIVGCILGLVFSMTKSRQKMPRKMIFWTIAFLIIWLFFIIWSSLNSQIMPYFS